MHESGNLTAYEVIRIIGSRPLFLNEHLDRLQRSLFDIDKDCILPVTLRGEFIAFVQKTGVVDGNIRIDAWFTETTQYRFYQIPHHYPTDQEFCNGVSAVTLIAERNNPESKIWNKELRSNANSLIESSGVWEVLLVNQKGNITEGSRSNFFAISGSTIVSAPKEQILGGITRKYVLEAIRSADNVDYIEQDIPLHSIKNFDAAFITGTSIKVLPLKSIDGQYLNVNNLILSQIISNFDHIMQRELNRNYEM